MWQGVRGCNSRTRMDTEDQWTQALASNNVRAILRWICSLSAEVGNADVEASLATFSSWVQRTAEISKKELLTLCFSRCQGLWIFLDHSCFTRVHLLLQRLKNLLTLAQWGRRQSGLTHFWHGLGIPCVVCRAGCGSSAVRQDFWNRIHRALKQHIWLGRLVQWWGITGLLPKYPEAQEMKRIYQMWREMDQNHRRASLHTLGWEEEGRERWNSLIQGMVAQMDQQHGPIWISEDCTDQGYPPPNLQALLKLVLVPRINNMSVQAILMYFILDMAHFLQCKDDLLQSFCHAFIIPPSFSQQIRAFWLLDHGHLSGSMELLLSPRSEPPWFSWQHHCIIHSLLRRKQLRLALKYIYWTRLATDTPHDLKLCVDVLLQNSHVSDAWALLKKGHTGRNDMVRYFLHGCERLGLCVAASDCMEAIWKDVGHCTTQSEEAEGQCGVEGLPQHRRTTGISMAVKEPGGPIHPLSALLYQSQNINTLSSEDFIRLLRESMVELRQPQPTASEEVTWPGEHQERRGSCRNLSLTIQALRHHLPRPSPVGMMTDRLGEQGDTEPPDHDLPLIAAEKPWTPAHLSSQSLSKETSESMFSFTSSPSLPCLRPGIPYVYGSTVMLQRIPSLLSDRGRCQNSQGDSPSPPADILLPDYPDRTLTLEGATDPVSFNSLSKDSMEVDELVFSTEWGVEDIMTCDIPGDDVFNVEEEAVPPVDVTLDRRHSLSRLNLHPQFYSNEDNQSVPSVSEIQVESHNFLTPDYEKMDYYKEVTDKIMHAPSVSDVWSIMPGGEKSGNIRPQTSTFSGAVAASSHCFLELEPLQRAFDPPPLEDSVECFRRDSQDAVDQPEILTSCALTETTQDLLSELHQTFCFLEELGDTGSSGPETERGSTLEGEQDSGASGRYIRPFSLQDSSLLIPLRRSARSRQLQVPGVSLSPRTSPSRTPQLNPSSALETSRDRLPAGGKASHKEDASCFRSTPEDRLGHCKLGSWWKQALETRRASTGLLPAIEQVSTISREKRASLVPGQPYSHSTINFQESPAKQRGDKWEVKQAEKEELLGRRGSGKLPHQRVEQDLASHRGARVKKGKRVKKA
ncbi:uncharacterized protein LOC116374695 [Oncorhynchus kisutch]|uniref:uncharacterized protein LOC116374695 n=1 Tax=Oncorhynchus kisutch TaxID=8019 RepID=UPI0012DEF08B|nr:uncharacterized protein LOC116374695 [Oncorhynchus kisutch]